MPSKAEIFVDQLLTPETHSKPSDTVSIEKIELELPPWYNKELFDKGRRFYWDHSFGLANSMFMGLIAVFSIPSIMKILVGSHRSSSVYTAYRRYLSTLLHVVTWFEHELKPNTKSWRSLHTVRTRHLRAGLAAKLRGEGTVSQRDIALTQWGFIGYAFLKPSKLGILTLNPDGWEAYNHFWRVMVHMIGLEERYNLCQETFAETREVCQLILDRVYTPCLENVPEYFEHMCTVMLEGMWYVNPTVKPEAIMYYTKYCSNVPGYIYTEEERIEFQKKLLEKLDGKPVTTGVESRSLVQKAGVEGLPDTPSRILYYHDFDTLYSVPAYKKLTCFEKYKLNFLSIIFYLYSTTFMKWYLNINYLWSLVLMKYCPYMAFYRFGIKNSLVDIFVESKSDDTKPLPNSHYYKERPPAPWYEQVWEFIW